MDLTDRYKDKLNKMKYDNRKMDDILLQLEVTNACNHKCVFCPNADSTRKKGMMDYDFAKRVMKECSDFLGSNKKICFHMNGEPLLYKNLSKLVKYSKELGYKYSFITTNGAMASKSVLIELFDSGLDSIKFSINAGSRETYMKIHGVDDFDKVMEALKFTYKYRIEKRLSYKIFVSCVGIKDNFKELEQFNQMVKPYCDEIVFYYPCSYAGQRASETKLLYKDMSGLNINTFEIKHTLPCAVLWNSINITCEGYLSLCCSEADNRLIVEDLTNGMTVEEAWMGSKMNEIRKRHMQKNIDDFPCASCIYGKEYFINNINKELFALSLSRINSEREDKVET